MLVDFHAHILPGADHGSSSVDMSLSQLRNASSAGVTTIVATPHFYPETDTVDDFLARREESFNALSAVNDTGIEIIKGAEVFLGLGIEKLPDLEKLCIEGTSYILVEPPPEPWPCWIMDSLHSIIRDRRLRPICAHIDRYSHLGRNKILGLNIDVQFTATAILDNRKLRQYYLELIADDAIHLIGSDVHGDGKLPYHAFSAAVKKIGKLMPYLTDNAQKIISSGGGKIIK